ncbi:MAG: hypothetical protein HY831_01265 [Candidatus Aenigmarchaeota archaeon]|nr:hypothetical protein [Candidatus Aenigmarchaeota archaeon]
MVDIKTIGKAIGGILLTLFILSTIFVYGLSEATSESSLKPVFTGIISEQLSPQLEANMDEFRLYTNEQCKKYDTINISITDSELPIKCDELKQVTNDKLVNFLSEKVFEKFYYTDYGCNDISCFKKILSKDPKEMVVLLSAQMNTLLKSLIIYLIIGIIISLAIIIASIQKLFPILKNVGLTLLVSGLVFIVMLFSKYFLPSAQGALGEFINKIVNTFTYLYGIVFAIGIMVAVIGYIGQKYWSDSKEHTEKKKSSHNERNNSTQKSKK